MHTHAHARWPAAQKAHGGYGSSCSSTHTHADVVWGGVSGCCTVGGDEVGGVGGVGGGKQQRGTCSGSLFQRHRHRHLLTQHTPQCLVAWLCDTHTRKHRNTNKHHASFAGRSVRMCACVLLLVQTLTRHTQYNRQSRLEGTHPKTKSLLLCVCMGSSTPQDKMQYELQKIFLWAVAPIVCEAAATTSSNSKQTAVQGSRTLKKTTGLGSRTHKVTTGWAVAPTATQQPIGQSRPHKHLCCNSHAKITTPYSCDSAASSECGGQVNRRKQSHQPATLAHAHLPTSRRTY